MITHNVWCNRDDHSEHLLIILDRPQIVGTRNLDVGIFHSDYLGCCKARFGFFFFFLCCLHGPNISRISAGDSEVVTALIQLRAISL